MNRTQYSITGKCPNCGKIKCSDDYFCEHCCYDWLKGKHLEPGRTHTGEL